MVGTFHKHEPCPECGSKDNLGRYTDGSGFCFGCNYYEPPSGERFNARKAFTGDSETSDGYSLGFFHGIIEDLQGTNIPDEGVHWLSKYGFGVSDALKFQWVWNPRSRQLLFPLRDEWDDTVCIQARNFNPERKSQAKYFNWGNKSKHFNRFISPVWWKDDSVVLTEDVLSAAKMSKAGIDGYPLLGTNITTERLTRLSAYYDEIFVWLDHDKFKEAVAIQDKIKYLGVSAHVILTTDDPKCYNIEQIREYIRSLHD